MREPWYYDVMAPVYDAVVPRDVRGICDSFDDILKRNKKYKQVVDLGCGTGRFAIELAKRKYRVLGIDLSERMLDIAQKKAQRAHFRVQFLRADMRDFLLPKKAKVIWARGSIGDLTRRTDLRRALKNIYRNLSNEGIFVLDVRDYDQHFRTHENSIVRDTRIFTRRNKKLIFSFALNLNKKTKIALIDGKVAVKDLHSHYTVKTRHTLRYFTEKELAKMLASAEFRVLEIMPGYPSEKGMKPRLVAVANACRQ